MSYGIGLIGLGGISVHHLAGYRRYGLRVVAGYDPSEDARHRFAAREPAARVYATLDSLLEDPIVEVLDLAAPHHADVRGPILEAISLAAKPVMIQKPLAMSYAEALTVVEMLERRDVRAMVNQNMCFAPGTLDLIDVLLVRKAVGPPFLAQIEVRTRYDPIDGHWFGKDPRWWTLAFTVHHLSLCHLLFGPPVSVFAVTGRDPAQSGVPHDGYGHLVLSYASGLKVVVLSTGMYYGARPRHHRDEELWVQGESGIIDWTPQGGLEISRPPAEGRGTTRIGVPVSRQGSWFPDAFGLAMSHFQQALDAHAAPICSAVDNLHVMAAIEAGYISATRNEAVRIPDVMGPRWQPDYGPGWARGFTAWIPPEPI